MSKMEILYSNDHKFGYFQEKELDGVKKSLRSDFLYNPYPQIKLVGKRFEVWRQATEDMLGKSKYYGTLDKRFHDYFPNEKPYLLF